MDSFDLEGRERTGMRNAQRTGGSDRRRVAVAPWVLLKVAWIGALVLVFDPAASAIAREPGATAGSGPADYREWVKEREESLRSPDGYLALCGLFWLNDGEHTIGTTETDDIVFPPGRGRERIGRVVVKGDEVTFVSAPDATVTCDGERVTSRRLVPDTAGEATKLQVGDLTFWLIERYGMLAIRLRDPECSILKEYSGTPRFPYSPDWRFEAKYEPGAGWKISVPSVLGKNSDEDVVGLVRFVLEGKPYKLIATGQSDGELFIIFGDKTNHNETYHGGRFLRVPIPKDGVTTVIDFNRAYNPPCAYSKFTTCPLVPKENELPLRVTAGERSNHKD